MKKTVWKNRISKLLIAVLVLCMTISCMDTEYIQAATGATSKTTYYVTQLNHTKGGKDKYDNYWRPGTMRVQYDSNSVTFCGSFAKGSKLPVYYYKKNFIKYGKKIFKLTSKTKYYSHDGYEEKDYPVSKSHFLSICKRLNGLVVIIKVTNGKVVSMTFHA